MSKPAQVLKSEKSKSKKSDQSGRVSGEKAKRKRRDT